MALENGWFAEREVMWPGQRFSLQVDKVLHQEKSEYQDIMVFDSTTYGRVLILDGAIQLTERDEFAYQEAIVHLPMFAHPDPKRVLIVGGGDGGVLREVCRHPGVEKVVMCEIDRRVCDVSKQFFADSMATAFSDPRASLFYMDAAKYMKEHANEFDVIIVDSSDPVGPAASLYTSDFYSDMLTALRPGGVVCTQGECQFLHLDLIRKVMGDAKDLCALVDYAYSTVPTYPDGQIGYILAYKAEAAGKAVNGTYLRTAKRRVPEAMKAKLRWYSEEVHSAAFVLPAFSAAKLGDVRAPQVVVAPATTSTTATLLAGVALGAVVGAAASFLLSKRK